MNIERPEVDPAIEKMGDRVRLEQFVGNVPKDEELSEEEIARAEKDLTEQTRLMEGNMQQLRAGRPFTERAWEKIRDLLGGK